MVGDEETQQNQPEIDMSEATRIRLSDKAEAAVKLFAEAKGLSLPEAAEKLILTGMSRRAAVSKFVRKNRKPKAAKAKKS
jgi:hypothetical protein